MSPPISALQRFAFLFAVVCGLLQATAASAQDTVRVAVYQNRPGIFLDTDGVVRGFYIDVLEHTAKEEGWTLQYVPGTWSELLGQLEAGELDLIAGIAYNAPRDLKYDFTRENVFANWGQVYVGKNKIDSVLGLQGKRVAGLKDDIYTLSFQELLNSFDVRIDMVEVSSYEEVLRYVSEGRVDAGITSRSSGNRLESGYTVHRSPIVCCAKEIRYATLEGQNHHILAGLDRQMATLKTDNNSLYFRSLNRWYGTGAPDMVPGWVWWALAVTVLGAGLVLFANVVLRRQVLKRTAQLKDAYDMMELRVDERTRELQDANDQLDYMARHDALTGLPNRRWFSEHLEECLKDAKRRQAPLAVMFLDLDEFKAINDTFGHDMGDVVLIETAKRIRRVLRESDKLARLGGDEFIIMLTELTSPNDAHLVAEKVISILSEPFDLSVGEQKLGVSIGISLFPQHGSDTETMLSNADVAMYDAKRAGKNTFAVYAQATMH
ncbi:diguanylate cyclase [Magnetovibrio sp. PR-2]|uniref:diguanylate cyclase domain-containing protein n=1 Tax=Magnetovibrio sp. PR-2 TaxID=3120356 RepID=UPI002FCE00FD